MKNLISFFLLATLLLSCKKDKGNSPSTSNADYYFIGHLDGAELKFEITASSNAEIVTSNDASLNPPDDCTYSYGCAIGTGFAELSEKSIEVSFPALYSGNCGEQETAFPGLFPVGLFPLGEDAGSVLITYFDGTENWSSFGSLQTLGEHFFEVKASEAVESGFGKSQKVSGELSCLLVNFAGQEKKLEGVKFSLSFWPEI